MHCWFFFLRFNTCGSTRTRLFGSIVTLVWLVSSDLGQTRLMWRTIVGHLAIMESLYKTESNTWTCTQRVSVHVNVHTAGERSRDRSRSPSGAGRCRISQRQVVEELQRLGGDWLTLTPVLQVGDAVERTHTFCLQNNLGTTRHLRKIQKKQQHHHH